MKSLELDKDNNLVIEGYIGILDNNAALAQDIRNIALLQKNEYIYNINKGVDWLEFLRTHDVQTLLHNIEEQIYSDSRVKSVIISASKSKNILNIITEVIILKKEIPEPLKTVISKSLLNLSKVKIEPNSIPTGKAIFKTLGSS